MDYLDRMMHTIYDWMENMIASLNDGEYWHIPSDDILIKINKQDKELVLMMGDTSSETYKKLKSVVPKIGYKISLSGEEYFIP